MILASYVRPHDKAITNDIHMSDRTAMYWMDNKIIFCEISHILSGNGLWVHAKWDFKMRDRWLSYKPVYHHFLGGNALVKRDVAYETTIGRL